MELDVVNFQNNSSFDTDHNFKDKNNHNFQKDKNKNQHKNSKPAPQNFQSIINQKFQTSDNSRQISDNPTINHTIFNPISTSVDEQNQNLEVLGEVPVDKYEILIIERSKEEDEKVKVKIKIIGRSSNLKICVTNYCNV